MLKPYVGWTLELRLGSELPLHEGDASGKMTVRPPTKTELPSGDSCPSADRLRVLPG